MVVMCDGVLAGAVSQCLAIKASFINIYSRAAANSIVQRSSASACCVVVNIVNDSYVDANKIARETIIPTFARSPKIYTHTHTNPRGKLYRDLANDRDHHHLFRIYVYSYICFMSQSIYISELRAAFDN